MKYKTKKERLQELREFVKVNDRLPSKESKNPIEKSLGNWIIKYGKKYPEVQEIWNKYRYRKKSKERLRELNVFVKVNNKLPSQKSKNPIEKSLGKWVQMYKKKFPEVQEIFDKYKYYKTPEERLQELREFVMVNNKLPNQKSKDLTERSLALWISINKKKYPEVQEIWDSFEHRRTPEERFLEFREWVIKNNKLPSQSSKNPVEKSLENWMKKKRNWDILKRFIAIFKFKDEHPELWELEISEA